jgi:lysophospholipase L1-like esterase
MRRCLLLTVLLLLLASGLFAQAPAVRNSGFEAVKDGVPTDWTCPPYWSGEFKSADDPALVHGGKRAAELRAVAKAGRTWGRILPNVMPIQVGLNYRFAVFAKGTGSLKLGVINYLPAEPPYQYLWQEQPTTLTDQWQEVALAFTPLSYTVTRIAPVIEIEGTGAVATLDDVSLAVVRQGEGSLTVVPYRMAPVGQETTLTVLLAREGKPAALPLLVIRHTAAGATPEEMRSGEDGCLRLTVKAPDAPELLRVDVVQADLGLATMAYVDVVTTARYAQFEAAARQAKLQPLPMHLLFFGDSLTDFSRGYNYVDQVVFWLNRANGGQVTYRNAGVGGDYITRSLDRLNGKAGTYRLEAYDGIFDPKPTRVFMMLGHNDSKLTSTSGFTEAVVKPDDYKAQFSEFIGKVKAASGASFTLLSPTSSVYEITKANADKAVAAGRGASLFGKPEVMAQYTDLTREVAQATGADFIDVFTPTRDHPDKPTLFTTDGVHLSLEGNHVLALEMLRHLGK